MLAETKGSNTMKLLAETLLPLITFRLKYDKVIINAEIQKTFTQRAGIL